MKTVLIALNFFLLTACSGLISEAEIDPTTYNADWTTTTHSNQVEPNFDVVFPQQKVLRFDITIPAENWVAMQNDLDENLSGANPMDGGPGGDLVGPGPDDDLVNSFTPIWVYGNLEFQSKTWNNIGIRFKGNSSLSSVYNSPISKFSFKLDFDEFEDDYPEIKNQRFYGFKQLNLNNNFDDASELREKVAPDLFREFGLVAPQTAFVALYVNYGDGAEYFGLYTLVEEVDNTVIKTQFNDDSGNLYKPEGNGATFAYGTFNTTDMYLKTNTEAENYSDVENLYQILHHDDRINSAENWRLQLESIFDIQVFLKWLVANTVIQNWDTYGRMSHNYYLYHNPQTDKLEWIPWDNNEAFSEGKQEGAINLDCTDVGTQWPIINYLMQDESYLEQYKTYVNEFTNAFFTPENMESVLNTYANLIREYVIAEESYYSFTSASQFEIAIDELMQHVTDRNAAVHNYLN